VDGRLRGCCGTGSQSLYQNTLSAARRALRDERVEPLGPDDVARLRIEIDVLGAPGPVAARTVAALERDIEPGVHGLVAQRGEERAVFTPSVAMARNWDAEALVRGLCEKAGWAPDAYRRRGVRLSRFLASTFIESADGGAARELLRGNVRIGGADWSRERIAAAIDDGAEYLLRAQRPDGGFVYEHDPATGQDMDRDNIVRQLATTWVLASLARRRGGARERAAVRRALGFLAAHVRPVTPGSHLLVLADEPDIAHLGSVAVGLLALVAAADDASPDLAGGLAERLAESILSLQRPDGGFDTHFPAATQPAAEDFYPGEAMLALMHLHARRPDPRYPEALSRALPYYRAHFRRSRAAAFVPWQTAAYAHLARLTGERAHAGFVFELADAILPLQYAGADVPHADYVGGYRAGRVPGIAAATYNEGVLEAYDLARRRGEGERAARYQRAALLAALFTLRLQVTRESAFHVRHPERALGAFRFSLAGGTLRIDHTEHALNSLLGVERILFPTTTTARAGSGDRAREEGSLASSGQRA
jgi:uncharacterized protein (TIGR00296 family)